MKKTFVKTIFKEIKTNFTRFIAIIAIVALGVGFLVGLFSATPDLYATANRYYDETSLYDLNIKSTLGFSDENVEEIRTAFHEDLETLEAYYQVDKMIWAYGQNVVGRVTTKDLKNSKINQLDLLDGYFPTSKNECVIERSDSILLEIPLGEEIDIDEVNYKVVGYVANPQYMAKEKEITYLGNGRLGCILYLDSTLNETETMTDIYLTFTNTKKMNSFLNEYDELIDSKKEAQTETLNNVLAKRKNELFAEAYEVAYQQNYDQLYAYLLEQGIPESMVADLVITQLKENETQLKGNTWTALNEEVDLEGAEIYCLDRNSNIAFYSYKLKAKKVEDISMIFPIFFFLIASLIAMTTITRMVEEDRMNIGTLKALGYSKRTILSKYIIYTLLACGIGALIGIACGIALLPYVIYLSYQSIYFLPPLVILYEVGYITFSVLSMIGVILLVTIWICVRTLKEKPSALLLGKAPRPGKRIILERIPFIWKRLKFKYKSSIRNIFRYKKNFFVMMFGVGGCCALLLAGFGIKDSVGVLNGKQYEDILKYNLVISIDDKNTEVELDIPEIEHQTEVIVKQSTIGDKVKIDTQVVICDTDINSFVDFYYKNKEYEFTNDTVIITKQIAGQNDLEIGDMVTVSLQNNQTKEFKITNICENYVGNYLYISKGMFYGSDTADLDNTIYALADIDTIEKEDDLMNRLLSMDQIIGVEMTTQTKNSFDSLMTTLNYLIMVIVLCSGALACIVIYNLTNINISERIKEIATLKVLGYHPREAAGYIYRETAMMTLFGIVFGLFLGTGLHYFILVKIETIGITFGASINWTTYILASVLTIVFAIIVDIIFIGKIRKIKMVESLKSID